MKKLRIYKGFADVTVLQETTTRMLWREDTFQHQSKMNAQELTLELDPKLSATKAKEKFIKAFKEKVLSWGICTEMVQTRNIEALEVNNLRVQKLGLVEYI